VALVELGHQPQSVPSDEPVRLDARLVLVETQIGVESRHADVDAWPGRIVIRIASLEFRLPQHVLRQKNDVHAMVILSSLRVLRHCTTSSPGRPMHEADRTPPGRWRAMP